MSVPERIAGHDWWHTIEVAPGVVTPGSWDLRATAERLPWPASLGGLRCLDVGTMDGFWAFELERRGAAEVVAVDLVDLGLHDVPARAPRRHGERESRERFRIAADLLDSRVEYLDRNVYDLDPADVGEFDLVVMGYVLQMLRDPLRGLEALRSVCRGHLILLETVSVPLSLLPSPVARLHARRDGDEWFVFNRRGLRQACRLAGFEVEAVTRTIRDRAGPGIARHELQLVGRAMYALGIRGRSVALRARARPGV